MSNDEVRRCPLCRQEQFVDAVRVDRAADGLPTESLNIAEREEAVRRMVRRGVDDGLIAARLELNRVNVWRIRKRLGLADPARQGVRR